MSRKKTGKLRKGSHSHNQLHCWSKSVVRHSFCTTSQPSVGPYDHNRARARTKAMKALESITIPDGMIKPKKKTNKSGPRQSSNKNPTILGVISSYSLITKESAWETISLTCAISWVFFLILLFIFLLLYFVMIIWPIKIFHCFLTYYQTNWASLTSYPLASLFVS